jgi:predicted Kef-type K+ transport protein
METQMEHNVSLITTIAAGFGLALILGLAAERLKIPALVGYLLAGIIIGHRDLSRMWELPHSCRRLA